MKIAFIIPSLSNHGPNVFTLNLINSLIKFNFYKVEQITVFYLNVNTKVNQLVFPCSAVRINFFGKNDLCNFDIIHTTMLKPDLYGAIRLKSSRVISGIHNEFDQDLKYLYSPLKALILQKIWLFSLRRIKNFIFSSQFQKDYYSQRLRVKFNYKVIPYGVPSKTITYQELPESQLIRKLKENHFIIGSCGLTTKRKGFYQGIEALSLDPKLAFVIIGDGEETENLLNYAKRIGVADRLLILGFKPNHTDYYQYFDCYLMCSFSEGFGIAMLDAISLKIPIICSNLKIYDDYFSGKVALFEAGNLQSLLKAIDSIYNNWSHYSNISKSLYDTYFSDFKMAEAHTAFYKSLI